MQVEKVVVGVLLPGMALMPAHAPLSLELWSLLRSFPYDTRFRFYHRVQVRCALTCTAEWYG